MIDRDHWLSVARQAVLKEAKIAIGMDGKRAWRNRPGPPPPSRTFLNGEPGAEAA